MKSLQFWEVFLSLSDGLRSRRQSGLPTSAKGTCPSPAQLPCKCRMWKHNHRTMEERSEGKRIMWWDNDRNFRYKGIEDDSYSLSNGVVEGGGWCEYTIKEQWRREVREKIIMWKHNDRNFRDKGIEDDRAMVMLGGGGDMTWKHNERTMGEEHNDGTIKGRENLKSRELIKL